MVQFERGGYVFDVSDGGVGEAGTVVLLHGFPQDSGAWSEVAPLLQDAGYRTLSLDMRGVSPGARPSAINQYRAVESVNDVLAMLDYQGLERVHVVGHDWGGYIAWALACSHPERLATMTSVATPHPVAFQRSLVRSTQALQSWYLVLFQLPHLTERLLAPGAPMWRAMVRGLPREHAQRYAHRFSDPAARSAALAWYRVQPREIVTPSIQWGRVAVPTMYVWGERDPGIGRLAARGTGEFVSGRYRFEPIKAGHWIPETRPVLLAALLVEHLGHSQAVAQNSADG